MKNNCLVPWKFGINNASQFNTDKIENNFSSLQVLSQKIEVSVSG